MHDTPDTLYIYALNLLPPTPGQTPVSLTLPHGYPNLASSHSPLHANMF